MKIIKIINNVVRIVTISVFMISLILFLINFKNLSDRIGVHFGPDGNFDVIQDKNEIFFVFYNYIVTLILFIIFEAINIGVFNVKTGLEMDEKTEKIFRSVCIIMFSLLRIFVCLFYSVIWSYYVATQTPLNVRIGAFFALLIIIWLLFMISYFIFNAIKYRKKKQQKSG